MKEIKKALDAVKEPEPLTEQGKMLDVFSASAFSHVASCEDLHTGGWIEKEDKLPNYDQRVLWYSMSGVYYVDSLDKDGNPWLQFMTHWMILPNPPNE